MEEVVRKLIKEALKKSYSYTAYRKLVDELAAAGKSTGPNQTEALIDYTKLNQRRMKRLDKTTKLSEAVIDTLNKLEKPVTWLVLTESWCGDAAQTMPIMNKLAEVSDKMTLRVILRDENEQLMDNFLTRGSRSIPKLIMVDDEVTEVMDCWGPRPSTATQMVKAFKLKYGTLTPEFKQDLQVWYNNDKGRTTIGDLLQLLSLK